MASMLLLGSCVAGADIRSVSVTPTNATVNVSQNLSPSSAQVTGRSVRLSPDRLLVRWNVQCTTGIRASSRSAAFLLNGRVIGQTGAVGGVCRLASNPSSSLDGRLSVKESLDIPVSVRAAVVREALRTTGNELPAQRRINRRVQVTLTRRFQDTGVSLQDAATVLITFDVRFNADFEQGIDESRLVDVQAQSRPVFTLVGQGNSRPIPVVWNTTIESVGSGRRLTVRSDRLTFMTEDGRVIGTENRGLSQRFDPRLAANHQPSDAVRLWALRDMLITPTHAQQTRRTRQSFRESVRVPASVVRVASRSGSGAIVIGRTFSDGQRERSASFRVPLSGVAGGEFQITRIDLRFDDGARSRVVMEGAPLQLVADINYQGTGLLRATWEFAPVGLSGSSFFRALPMSGLARSLTEQSIGSFATRQTTTQVRQYLNSFQKVSLLSPVLPSGQVGRYLVRLRLDSPETDFESPAIAYSVNPRFPEEGTVASDVIEMRILDPQPAAEVLPGQEFRWQPVGLTSVYRYEVYESASDTAAIVTGAAVSGASSRAELTPLVVDRLQAGRQYWWRVVAIDASGATHGISPMQPFSLSKNETPGR